MEFFDLKKQYQNLKTEIDAAVLRVLESGVFIGGEEMEKFEKEAADFLGAKHAIGLNSGTDALFLALKSLEIGAGDEVITTPFTFFATAEAIVAVGAKPVFVDIDPQTLNIDPKKIEEAITENTKAILAVDVFGYPAEWKKILAIAQKHNLRVIEDSCEALGAEYYGKKCGSFGDAGVFAFYPNKQITTGEGGVLVTDNIEIADLCRSMSNQGREAKNGKWLEHIRLGYNYRMSDINASLGVAQLSRIDDILRRRAIAAARYKDLLKGLPEIDLPFADNYYNKRSWFVYVITLSNKYSRQDRDSIINAMAEKDIQCASYFQCIHLQPFYRREFCYREGLFPVAESISDRTIALPFFSNIKEDEIQRVAEQFKKTIIGM